VGCTDSVGAVPSVLGEGGVESVTDYFDRSFLIHILYHYSGFRLGVIPLEQSYL
jgi:hypothetical protein